MRNSLVSVIIPSYGGSEYIQRCINSVLCQTYQNIEVIVVDDNGLGTDFQMSLERIMAEYKNDKRVHYICHEVNRNGSAARNTGVKYSHGEYIALLDDDDEYTPEKIEKQVKLLESLSDEYALVYCSQKVYKGEKLIRINRALMSGYLFYEKMMKQFSIQTSSVLLRRTVYEEFGGFDESFRRHQDWEFIERIMSKYKICADDFIGCICHIYFRNSSFDPNKREEWMNHYLSKMEPYIDKLSKDKYILIIRKNRMEIALCYLKAKCFRDFVVYCIKYRLSLGVYVHMAKRIINSILSGGPIKK